jgi:hypothetical protein
MDMASFCGARSPQKFIATTRLPDAATDRRAIFNINFIIIIPRFFARPGLIASFQDSLRIIGNVSLHPFPRSACILAFRVLVLLC